MKRLIIMATLSVILATGGASVYAHCGHCGVGEPSGSAKAVGIRGGERSICGKCGEIKGSANCCKDAAACEKCGLHKGSAGCCKMHAGDKDKALCSKCGEIKGSDGCCKDGAERCSHCGMIKGSAGCCVADAEPATSEAEGEKKP